MNLLDLSIISIFFIITFVIGVIQRKKITLEDYWVNSRKTRTFFLVATIFSTFIGVGAILGTAGVSFSGGGLAPLMISASFLFYFLIFSRFFAHKIKEFGDKNKAYTLPDFFEYRYSKKTRILAAIINLFTYTLYIALQMLGMGIFVNTLTNFNPTLATIIGGIIVILYTYVGGLKADIRTDVFQFIIMLSLLFIFLPLLVISAGGFSAIFTLPKEFLIGTSFAPWYVIILAFFFIGAGTLGSAEIWQRAYAAKDKNTAKKASLYAAILVALFLAMAVLFGIYGKLLLPNTSSNTVVADLLKTYIPAGLYGLILAGFFAAIMSSADTMILIAGMTFVRDIYHKSLRKKASNEELLKLSRYATLVLGALGLIAALIIFDIAHIAIEAISFYIVLIPSIVFGFYWRNANSKAAFWSILLGLIILIIFLFISPIQAFIPATIVSFLSFIIIAFLSKQKS